MAPHDLLHSYITNTYQTIWPTYAIESPCTRPHRSETDKSSENGSSPGVWRQILSNGWMSWSDGLINRCMDKSECYAIWDAMNKVIYSQCLIIALRGKRGGGGISCFTIWWWGWWGGQISPVNECELRNVEWVIRLKFSFLFLVLGREKRGTRASILSRSS